MTHRFFFKAESGEVVGFAAVDPDLIARDKPSVRAEFLWNLDSYLNVRGPLLNPQQMVRYYAWTTEVMNCAVSKVKRRLYVKAKK